MQIEKFTYSESVKKPTAIRFESKLVSVSATITITPEDNLEEASRKVKEYVKKELQKEIDG